jgi:hypothetical protein
VCDYVLETSLAIRLRLQVHYYLHSHDNPAVAGTRTPRIRRLGTAPLRNTIFLVVGVRSGSIETVNGSEEPTERA